MKQEVYFYPRRRTDKHIVFVTEEKCNNLMTLSLLDHAKELAKGGYRVTVVYKGEVMTYEGRINFQCYTQPEELLFRIPDCHCIVTSTYGLVKSLVHLNMAPVVYLEEGGNHMLNFKRLSVTKQGNIRCQITSAAFILAENKEAARFIRRYFNRKVEYITRKSKSCILNWFCQKLRVYKIRRYYKSILLYHIWA